MNKYHNCFVTNKYDISNRRKPKFKKKNIFTKYDICFFNLMNIVRHESITPFYDRNVERQTKLEISQKMDNIKFKQKDRIIETLAYEENINIEVIDALCIFFFVNAIYISDKCFFKMFHGDIPILTSNIIVINKNCDVYHMKYEKIKTQILALYEITNIMKPMNSMSYYKVQDLKNISEQIGVEIEEKMKKKDIYDFLHDYFTQCITITN